MQLHLVNGLPFNAQKGTQIAYTKK